MAGVVGSKPHLGLISKHSTAGGFAVGDGTTSLPGSDVNAAVYGFLVTGRALE